MRRVTTAVGAGLLLGAIAIAITLSRSPLTVARRDTSSVTAVLTAHNKTTICQAGESIPRGTSAIRLTLDTFTGPRVTVTVSAHERIIARGERGSGWTGGAVTVPVDRIPEEVRDARVCFTPYLNGDETAALSVSASKPAAVEGTRTLPGHARIDYLEPGHSSWWSLAPEVARRMGLGRAASGTWIVVLAIALMAGVVVLSARVLIRELP